jgi:transposase InsO family protein
MDYVTLIDRIYEKNNYPGYTTLIKLVQKEHPTITKTQIKKWHDAQLEVQLLHAQHKKEASGHVVADAVDEIWNLDILDLSKYKDNNNGYRYILAVVDVFSRKAYCEPMQTKDGETAGATLLGMMMEHKKTPKVLLTDNDSAYTGAFFSQVLEEKKVILNMNVVDDHHAMGIIDNFARRIKFIFSKMFIKSKQSRWINKLKDVVDTYYKTPHSSLGGLSPNDATKEENTQLIQELNQTKRQYNKTVSDLKPNDKVRKLLKRKLFAKGTEPKWSDEVYKVVSATGNKVKLDDDTVNLRQHSLQVPHDTT